MVHAILTSTRNETRCKGHRIQDIGFRFEAMDLFVVYKGFEETLIA
jgi:hypothetical protein